MTAELREEVLRSFLVNCTGTLAERVLEQSGCVTQKVEERKLLFTARICSLDYLQEELSILFLYLAFHKYLAGIRMFSLIEFLFLV